jgi:hypothetical protein
MDETPFDPDLSRQIDLATVLAEDTDRPAGKQAMALAWLAALEALIPDGAADARQIELSQGKIALVDAADYGWLSQWKWTAHQMHGGIWYAMRTDFSTGGPVQVYMHRLILDTQAGKKTDHVNGNGLDNRRANLRPCTTAQNAQNQHKRASPTTSRFKGVFRNHNRWGSRIAANGKRYWLGAYGSELEAARAYNEAAARLHGAFARLNDLPSAPEELAVAIGAGEQDA